jgi:hypothetical protein
MTIRPGGPLISWGQRLLVLPAFPGSGAHEAQASDLLDKIAEIVLRKMHQPTRFFLDGGG